MSEKRAKDDFASFGQVDAIQRRGTHRRAHHEGIQWEQTQQLVDDAIEEAIAIESWHALVGCAGFLADLPTQKLLQARQLGQDQHDPGQRDGDRLGA